MKSAKCVKRVMFLILFASLFLGILIGVYLKITNTKTIDVFDEAIKSVLKNEGLYSNDVDDAGGETKFGISKRSYPNLDIKNLSVEKAKKIYKKDFWENQNYKNIKNKELAIKIFDLAVNIGSSRANKLIQRSLRSVNKKVEENGVLDDVTICLINESDATDLLSALKSEAAGYYRLIVSTKPHRAKFLKGWLNRAYK
jgi:lysozyme family protein